MMNPVISVQILQKNSLRLDKFQQRSPKSLLLHFKCWFVQLLLGKYIEKKSRFAWNSQYRLSWTDQFQSLHFQFYYLPKGIESSLTSAKLLYSLSIRLSQMAKLCSLNDTSFVLNKSVLLRTMSSDGSYNMSHFTSNYAALNDKHPFWSLLPSQCFEPPVSSKKLNGIHHW